MAYTPSKIDWSTITVFQFQQFHDLFANLPATDPADPYYHINNLDTQSQLIGILYNQTVDEVDNLIMDEYCSRANSLRFLLSDTIPGKAKRYLDITTDQSAIRFRINYRPFNIKSAHLKMLLDYLPSPIQNLHKIMAVMIIDSKFTHQELSTLVLNAPLAPVYHAMCYYIKLFTKAMEAIKPDIIAGLPIDTAEQLKFIIDAANKELAGYNK